MKVLWADSVRAAGPSRSPHQELSNRIASFPDDPDGATGGCRVVFGGTIPVDHYTQSSLVRLVDEQLGDHSAPPVTVSSVNLDHIHRYRDGSLPPNGRSSGRWIYVADGAPVARRAGRVVGRSWPRLAGADLLPVVLDRAGQRAMRVAVVGGTTEMHAKLQRVLERDFPGVAVAGMWSPTRADLAARDASAALAAEVAATRSDVVIVSLPKPMSEIWIADHATEIGARLFLPFGAATDFLSGHVRRAPVLMQRLGLEWLFRLGLQPKRMARRYLVHAPRAYSTLRQPAVVQ